MNPTSGFSKAFAADFISFVRDVKRVLKYDHEKIKQLCDKHILSKEPLNAPQDFGQDQGFLQRAEDLRKRYIQENAPASLPTPQPSVQDRTLVSAPLQDISPVSHQGTSGGFSQVPRVDFKPYKTEAITGFEQWVPRDVGVPLILRALKFFNLLDPFREDMHRFEREPLRLIELLNENGLNALSLIYLSAKRMETVDFVDLTDAIFAEYGWPLENYSRAEIEKLSRLVNPQHICSDPKMLFRLLVLWGRVNIEDPAGSLQKVLDMLLPGYNPQ